MKNIIFIIFSCCLFSIQLSAQIHLIGARVNETSGGIDVATWHADDPASVVFHPTMLTGYFMASSVFDAYRSNYYLTGITGSSEGLFSFNSSTYEQTLTPFNNFSNITEIDMSTGKIYNLTMVSSDSIIVNEYDILSGTESILGVIYEPGANGIVVDAISFNSNDGILMYLGFDAQGNQVLYSVNVREPLFSYTKTIVQVTPQNSITFLAYDNLNDLLFALQFQYNGGTNIPGVVEINVSTGEVSSRGVLSDITGLVAGSSCFDQYSGSYMLVGIDTANLFRLIIFDTYSGSYVTKDMPGNVSEIICDNYNFARSAYGTTGIRNNEQSGISIFPNPSDGNFVLSLHESDEPMTLKLYNLSGQECFSGLVRGSVTNFSVHHLRKGIYTAKLFGSHDAKSFKIVIR